MTLPSDPPKRDPLLPIRLELPLPPSLWKLHKNKKGGKGRARSEQYGGWLAEAGWTIIEAGWKHSRPLNIPFVLDVAFERPDKCSDLDNRLKAVGDFLQHMGVVANDRLCERISARWATGLPAPCVVIIQAAEEGMAA